MDTKSDILRSRRDNNRHTILIGKLTMLVNKQHTHVPSSSFRMLQNWKSFPLFHHQTTPTKLENSLNSLFPSFSWKVFAKSIYQTVIYDLYCMSTYENKKQKERERERNEGNMYNFTVCWNDIKYIYVSHIVYNITNWYRFYLKFMYVKASARVRRRKRKGKEKGKRTAQRSSEYIFKLLRIFHSMGYFSFWIFHLACKTLRLRHRGRAAKAKRRKILGKEKTFFFPSCVCTRAWCLTYEKKGTWMFFHYISCELLPSFLLRHTHFARVYTSDGCESYREIYLCAYDQGPNKTSQPVRTEMLSSWAHLTYSSWCEYSHVCCSHHSSHPFSSPQQDEKGSFSGGPAAWAVN